MRHFKVVGVEVREKTLSILDEVPPESYEPPYELEEAARLSLYLSQQHPRMRGLLQFQIEGTAKNSRSCFGRVILHS